MREKVFPLSKRMQINADLEIINFSGEDLSLVNKIFIGRPFIYVS